MSVWQKWLAGVICVAGCLTGYGGEPVSGWRGNGTGVWPAADAPVTWMRIPHGALEDLRASADRPVAGQDLAAVPVVEKGLLRHWLVLGPLPTANSLEDLDEDLIGGEANLEPSPDMETAGLTWKSVETARDDAQVFGTAELPWLDLSKEIGFQPSHFAYAHTYLHSPRGGRARIVVQHGEGLKAWLNGQEVYRSPRSRLTLGFYPGISRMELDFQHNPAGRMDLELQPGWNRLLIKVGTSPAAGVEHFRCLLRIMDPPDVAYETENIRWMTELRGRSTSTPIIVGDRLFVMAEPDELMCLDKQSGQVLWTRPVNPLEALTAEERAALPALAERADPLVARIAGETDPLRRLELRAQLKQVLTEIDATRFDLARDGHFDAHFGIVGFTMPTPVSDGEHIYAWVGNGVAACFDLQGERQWITQIRTDQLTYGASPALADGVLAVFLNELYGLDAATGKQLWKQFRVRRNVGAVMAARLAGEPTFITQAGEFIRPSDGELLFRPKGYSSSDTGWAPPVILGNQVYVPRYGVAQINIFDLGLPDSTLKQPAQIGAVELPTEIHKGPDGKWIDRWTAGSPLIHDGLAYAVDIYQNLYVADVKTGKMTSQQPLPLEGFTHYNAVAVTASPTLIGDWIYICDNQGTTLVLEPGPEPRIVSRNRIQTQLERWQTLPAQETLAYAPPIVDGNRIYLRGERFLYCIGKD